MLEIFDISELPVADNQEDKRIWNATLTGEFSVASAVEDIRRKNPKLQWTKQTFLCCDGTSRGNPGISGYGFIERSSEGECIVSMAGGLGVAINYYAEVMALLCAGEWEIKNGKLDVTFRIDSKAVITTFTTGHIPWFGITRWRKITEKLQVLRFVHNYREVNLSADSMAKMGANMER
ncbi:uncharacterized protein LOC113315586 [Papaver somniferum]|uniref:uncharacterized protein LOC113315586 n=1 Tax=Papaver somniferum TaxID=3469 RepID=UPI000E700A82|nr:uncharacterized protein LOC113315586 [Papaver somniferum]